MHVPKGSLREGAVALATEGECVKSKVTLKLSVAQAPSVSLCEPPPSRREAFGENRFIRALPFRQIKLLDKSKFEADKLRFIEQIVIRLIGLNRLYSDRRGRRSLQDKL